MRRAAGDGERTARTQLGSDVRARRRTNSNSAGPKSELANKQQPYARPTNETM